jgi:hypothetical protein
MLATEEKKLRWMGIDFRSRWRRRAAVVLTYAGFFVILEVAIGDPRWAGHPYLRLVAMGALTFLLQAISVFRNGGLVKKFALPRLGVEPKHMVVGSLDEWARYRYGAPGFDAATDEQQKELLRTYHVGNYLVPAKPLENCLLDERERAERDSTSRWVLGQLAWILALMTGSTAMQRRPFTPFEVAALLWIFFILAITLPQARILWIEPDPRDAAGPHLAAKSA